MSMGALETRLASGLQGLRRPDGGFPASAGAPSELESTAVASLALDDGPARRWLSARLRGTGALVARDGRAAGPATGALVALALADDRRLAGRALAYALSGRGLPPPNIPQDRRSGWGWTRDARSLVEPTARMLLALRLLTPSDRASRAEAVALLADRRCADGGWNYGNPSHVDVDLRSYAQTTAFALIALRAEGSALVDRALAFLRSTWHLEPGTITIAQTAIAFRLHGLDGDASGALASLEAFTRRPTFFDHPIAVAWSVMAAGPAHLLAPLGGTA